MDGIYSRQSEEGWFLEYEGADPGYQTLDMHYQALFFKETDCDRIVLAHVEKSLEFLAYFLHPDGSIGGEYGSRSCPHFFRAVSRLFPSTSCCRIHGLPWAAGLASGNSCGLADADERNSVPLATSYMLAHMYLCKNGAYPLSQLPYERNFELYGRNQACMSVQTTRCILYLARQKEELSSSSASAKGSWSIPLVVTAPQ